ncbi:MAG: DEAD/DEAH box helicase, partial [Actinobacteria bacterium]|nr:DEAD/DEAH box helicase [Actinomycetota bacterium]
MTRLVRNSPEEVLGRLTFRRPDRLRHTTTIPAREATTAEWPDWVPSELLKAWAGQGITLPWAHQVRAAEFAHAGRDVVIATGTASGKSLAFTLPALSAVHRGLGAPNGRGSTTLYL